MESNSCWTDFSRIRSSSIMFFIRIRRQILGNCLALSGERNPQRMDQSSNPRHRSILYSKLQAIGRNRCRQPDMRSRLEELDSLGYRLGRHRLQNYGVSISSIGNFFGINEVGRQLDKTTFLRKQSAGLDHRPKSSIGSMKERKFGYRFGTWLKSYKAMTVSGTNSFCFELELPPRIYFLNKLNKLFGRRGDVRRKRFVECFQKFVRINPTVQICSEKKNFGSMPECIKESSSKPIIGGRSRDFSRRRFGQLVGLGRCSSTSRIDKSDDRFLDVRRDARPCSHNPIDLG